MIKPWPTKPERFKVWYLESGTNRILPAWAIAVIKDDVVLEDGWNPAIDTFLSKEQCRRFHKLPPEDYVSLRKKIKAALQKIIEWL